MTSVSDFDIGSLIWVKGEIDQALDQAAANLQQLAGQALQPGQLRFSLTHLHQVTGAINMVGLDALGRFSEEIELAVQAIDRGERSLDEQSVRTLCDAATAFKAYLDDLVNNRADAALALYPFYRAVREFRGESSSEAELFYPDLNVGIPPLGAANVAASDLLPYLKDQRSRFQAGLLQWLRDHNPAGLQAMFHVLRNVAKVQASSMGRGFWWSAAALVEVVAYKGIDVDADIRQLFTRLDLQLRRASEGSSKVAERLFRDLLYYIAVSRVESPNIKAVRQAFQLLAYLPRRELDLNRAALAARAQSARTLLQQVKDAWGKYTSGNPDKRAACLDALTGLKSASVSLEKPEFGQVVEAIARAVSSQEKPLEDSQAMEVATALLLLENALNLFPEWPEEFPIQAGVMHERLVAVANSQWNSLPSVDEVPMLDDATRRVQERQLQGQVAREIRANLQHIEQTLDSYFRQQIAADELKGLNAELNQIKGALAILDMSLAQEVLSHCATMIGRFASESNLTSLQDHQDVAEGLSALGFYIDEYELGRDATSQVLEPVIARIRGLNVKDIAARVDEPAVADSVEAELKEQQNQAMQLLDALREKPEDSDVKEQLVETLSSIKQNADLIADAQLLESSKTALQVLETAAPEAAVQELQEAIAGQDATEPPAAAAEDDASLLSDEAVDAELLEIYLEEAQEVLANVAEQLEQCEANPHDREALTTIRRSFHTLKGSGRMVGLNNLGEVAWAVEQMMNEWLQAERSATPSLLYVLDQARARFLGWVEQLQGQGTVKLDPKPLQAMSSLLRESPDLGVDDLRAQVDSQLSSAAPAAVEEAPLARAAEPAAIEEIPALEAAPVETAAIAEEITAPDMPLPEQEAPAIAGLELAGHDYVETIMIAPRAPAEETPAAAEVPELQLESLDLPPVFTAEEVPASLQAPSFPSVSGTVELELEEEADEQDIRIGKVAISPILFDIFAEEAQKHLGALKDGLRGVESNPEDGFGRNLVFAAHTLRGIANTTGFRMLGDLGEALETWLAARARSGQVADDYAIGLMQTSVIHAERMIQNILQRQWPDPAEDMIEALHHDLEGSAPSNAELLQANMDGHEEWAPPAEEEFAEGEFRFDLDDELPSEADVAVEAVAEAEPEPELELSPAVAEDAAELVVEAALPSEEEIEEQLVSGLEADLAGREALAESGLLAELPLSDTASAAADELEQVEAPAELTLEEDVAEEPVAESAVSAEDNSLELEFDLSAFEAPAASAEAVEDEETLEFELHDQEADVQAGAETADAAPLELEVSPEFIAEAAEEELGTELAELAETEAAPADAETELVLELDELAAEADSDLPPEAVAAEETAAEETFELELPPAETELTEFELPQPELTELDLVEPEEESIEIALEAPADEQAEVAAATEAPVEEVAALDELEAFDEQVASVAEPVEASELPESTLDVAELAEPVLVADAEPEVPEPVAEVVDSSAEPVLESPVEAAPVEAAPVEAAPEALAPAFQPLTPELIGSLVVETPAAAPAAPLSLLEQALAINDDIDEQLLPIFIEEGQELLPEVSACMRKWQDNPADAAADCSKQLKRLLHTLKGSARMAGAMRLGEATHHIETRLIQSLDSGMPAEALLEELSADIDVLDMLFEALVRGETLTLPSAPGAEPAEAAVAEVSQAEVQTQAQAAIPLQQDQDAAKAMLRVRADLIDRLVNDSGEVAIARSRIEAEMIGLKRSLHDLTENVSRLRAQLREIEIQAESQMQSRMSIMQDEETHFDPLEFDRFTRLQELTRFMAESVNDVATIQFNLLNNLGETEAALQQQGRMTKELQQQLMRIRMVPFSNISERLYRIVRQTGKELGKKVNLEFRGGRVEIDRSVLEKMTSPFEHMLRNSIDHGLESREERLAAGKPEVGEVRIEARQEGNELILTLHDDGKGMNLQRIRQKGLELGLLQADQAISDEQLMQLIFAPGFSTAQNVTQISGRGIGMDVVRSEIVNLGGRIEVETQAGHGTTFTIHLPLTMAVTHVVLVRVGERQYAIPSIMVEQVQELKIEPLGKLYEQQKLEWMGNLYPFSYMGRLLGDDKLVPETRRYNTVLLIKSGTQRIAVHVDELIRNLEVVVKNISPQLARAPGISGATVLGNGDIVMILNPIQLMAVYNQRLASMPATPVASDASAPAAPVAEAPAETSLTTAPVIMVVDDSLTVRKITGRLLAREGYQVMTAKDGVDALQQLQEMQPDVMLLDIEMPRMDGFELTRNIRGDAATRDIPIIMISSRTADKHKNYAYDLGVNVFLGKPYQEDELLGHITNFCAQRRAKH